MVMRNILVVVFCLLLAAPGFAVVEMLSPVASALEDGASIQAGFVEPNQSFELIFSDNSGYGFEWNTVSVDTDSLPRNWRVVSTDVTDTSLVVAMAVPRDAAPNFYNVRLVFSNDRQPAARETLNVRVTVRHGLLDVGFARHSPGEFSVVGSEVLYKAVIANSSISRQEVEVSSSLPANWFSPRTLTVKPNSVLEEDLIVKPQVYGKKEFSFQAMSPNTGLVVKSFSSALNVRPTLKGKFLGAFSGFPFFTFSLLPFQVIDSFFGFALPE